MSDQVKDGSKSPMPTTLKDPRSSCLHRLRNLHQSDDDHASNTGQGDLARLEGNTSVLGALGGSSGSDGRTGAGRGGRLVVGRGDAGADEVVVR